jgi:hypothetical protein
MPKRIRDALKSLGLSLALAGNLLAQQTEAETQRASLAGLRTFAVYARVQQADSATLPGIDETLLRAKLESALGRVGISVVGRNEVRDGSDGNLSLLYLVLETRDRTGRAIKFAASSCLQAAQIVRIPRLTTAKHIAYTVVPTWRSCGLLVGDAAAYTSTILQNANAQIARFLDDWRSVNVPRQSEPSLTSPELGMISGRVEERASK